MKFQTKTLALTAELAMSAVPARPDHLPVRRVDQLAHLPADRLLPVGSASM